jgi:Na+-driven multidrug efflux pump
MAFQNAIIAVGGMIVTSVVNGFGVVFIGGYTATNKLYGILEVAATSYGYAMVTYTGQNLGAGKISRIRQGMKAAMVLSMITSVVIAGIMILFGKGILSLFLSGTPEETAAAMEVAYQYLLIMSLCLPILYVLHVVRSAIQGMGDTVKPMISGIAEFIMRTAGSLTLPGILGGSGVFLAEVSAWLGADLILVPSYFITLKKLEKE